MPAFRHALKAAGVPWWSIAMAGLVRWMPLIITLAAQILPLFASGGIAGASADGRGDVLDDPAIHPAVKDAVRAYRAGTLGAD